MVVHQKGYLSIISMVAVLQNTILFVAFCLLLSSAIGNGKLTKPVQATFTCDSELTLFVDGRFAGSSKNWRQPITYTFPIGSRLVAVLCRDSRDNSEAGIMGSFHNGLVTDSQWSCIRLGRNEKHWQRLTFDDHYWPLAVEYFANGEYYEKIKGISEQAFWIWTAYKATDHVVGCRRLLSDVVPLRAPKQGIYVSSLENVDFSLHGHVEDFFKVVDVDQCAQECRKDADCRSFNFQHIVTGKPMRACELNKLSRYQAPRQYSSRPGYTYYDDVSG